MTVLPDAGAAGGRGSMRESALADAPIPPASTAELARTPLHALHRALGARMVPFAGYDMPVQYEGILAEHLAVRAGVGLFDVSHMGQAVLEGPDAETVARALEALMPGDFLGLAPGRLRYSMLLTEEGGILDDLMVTRGMEGLPGHYLLVVNAACKGADFAHIEARLPAGVRLTRLDDRALLALQGPGAEAALARLGTDASAMTFMSAAPGRFGRTKGWFSRSGYTGEDGFELSVPAEAAEGLARALIEEGGGRPIGLGARDSLRLEAGLCLYGSDIDTTTSPIEAGLGFAIPRRRRAEGGFPGHARIAREIAEGPARLRVGLLPEGPAPARAHTEIQDSEGRTVGEITSGGFSPSLSRPVAMGYVEAGRAAEGTALAALVRGKARSVSVAPMPFVPHRYRR